MGEKRKKVSNEPTEASRKQMLLQYGLPVVLFVIVLVIIISNYFAISRNDANEDVEEHLILQCMDNAGNIYKIMSASIASASTVAAIMGNEENCTPKDIITYAKELSRTQEDCYMVIIADNQGDGFSSEGEKIDISDRDYFTVSRSQRYCMTQDDGVFNRKAYVFAVPYYQHNISVGNIYLFISEDKLTELLPLYVYDMKSSYAICDSKGNLLASYGQQTKLFENDQYIENLRGALLNDMSFARITNRMSKQVKFVYDVRIEEEEKTVVNIPLGISDWQYLTVLNRNYVDRLVANEWQNIRVMTIRLGVVVLIFGIVIAVIVVINRLHFNQQSKELADKADTDLLTELNNKIATERKIQEYIEENPDSQCLFFLFDIDNFKKINDTLGHAFGDEVLRSLGQQLRNEFRVSDIIGRTGGDEFILFLKNMNSDETLEKEAKRFADFFHHFKAGEYVKYSATASIGAAVYPRDAKDYHGLYKAADSALYEAKRRGKNRLVFYNKELEEVNPNKKKETPIESDMR
ncbi:MAG: diguanylate cyclase [Lachnospiraceae bacterium]|nr:diguanylate cyclase [Lachnospiraceae bacterium]